jgi:hypothetical protein
MDFLLSPKHILKHDSTALRFLLQSQVLLTDYREVKQLKVSLIQICNDILESFIKDVDPPVIMIMTWYKP